MPSPPHDIERFRIEGNRLIVTSRFDPRYQREAEGELLHTLDGLFEERTDGRVVLDLHDRNDLPSMLIGLIMEAHRRATSAGRSLILVVRPDHLKSLHFVGLQRVFDETASKTDDKGVAYLEFTSKPLDS